MAKRTSIKQCKNKNFVGIGIYDPTYKFIRAYVGDGLKTPLDGPADLLKYDTYEKVNEFILELSNYNPTIYTGTIEFAKDFDKYQPNNGSRIINCYLFTNNQWFYYDYCTEAYGLLKDHINSHYKEVSMPKTKKITIEKVKELSAEEKARIEKEQKDLKESEDLYKQAIDLLKAAADKTNALAAFLYGAACLLEKPRNNFAKAEALKYLYLSTTAEVKTEEGHMIAHVGKAMYNFANNGTFTAYVPAPANGCFGYGPMMSNPVAELQRMGAAIVKGDTMTIK